MTIETEFASIPSSEADRKAITDAISELTDSFRRQDAEKDLQKDIGAAVKEKTGLKTALLNKFARWQYNGTVDRDVTKITEEEAAYRVLYPGAQAPVDSSED